jgi:hypothetical protein
MTEPASVEQDGRFDWLGVDICPGTCGNHEAVLTHSGFQALPHFVGLPWLQADGLRPLTGGKDLSLKVEALVWQRAKCVGQLQVDEMFRRLGGTQLGLCSGAPAIGLGAKVFDIVDGGLCAQKGGNIGGEVARGQPVDHAMALLFPCAGAL